MSQPATVDDARDLVEGVLIRLRARGGRATPARRLLLMALSGPVRHLSAKDLAAEVRTREPDVNLSTIYRNLDQLRRVGVVEAHFGHGPATYHLASAAHGHLVCSQCRSLTEVPEQVLSGLAGQIRSQYGFTIDPHRFAVTGLCSACQP